MFFSNHLPWVHLTRRSAEQNYGKNPGKLVPHKARHDRGEKLSVDFAHDDIERPDNRRNITQQAPHTQWSGDREIAEA